jgi:glycosyltransferase involved in cell wall biosynthesis
MKIAFVGQKGVPAQTGGVEKQVEELLLHLVERGHIIYAYARRGYAPTEKEYKRIKLITLPFIKGKNFEAISHTFLAILDLIFRRKVDIIHFQSIGPASLLFLLKIFKPNTPIVFTFHCQDYYHQKWGLFARWYLRLGENIGCRLADKTFITSQELTSYTAARYKNNPMYMPSGINQPIELQAKEIKSKWGLEKDSYILSASRLVRHKGVHYLIEAFKRTKTDKKLVIAGGSAHTEDYIEELYRLAKGDERIIFTGNQSGDVIKELYSNTCLFVQPSEYEGLSMGLLEAMSYGLPCLASDIPANKEALGGLGFTFENKNIDSARQKLTEILAMEEKQLKESGRLLKERTLREYNWSSIVDDTLAIYEKLVNKK